MEGGMNLAIKGLAEVRASASPPCGPRRSWPARWPRAPSAWRRRCGTRSRSRPAPASTTGPGRRPARFATASRRNRMGSKRRSAATTRPPRRRRWAPSTSRPARSLRPPPPREAKRLPAPWATQWPPPCGATSREQLRAGRLARRLRALQQPPGSSPGSAAPRMNASMFSMLSAIELPERVDRAVADMRRQHRVRRRADRVVRRQRLLLVDVQRRRMIRPSRSAASSAA